MKNRKKEKKVIALFLGMFLYCSLLLLFFQDSETTVNSSNYSSTNFQNNKELVEALNSLEYQMIQEVDFEEVDFDEDDVVEIIQAEGSGELDDGEVKGVLREFVMGSCDAVIGIEEPQLFCGDGGAQQSNVEMTLAEIFAPDILFLGAAAPFDNLVLTNNPRGATAFRNASEIINPESDYLIKKPPFPEGHPLDPREPMLEEEMQDEPFLMHYDAAGTTTEVDFDTYPGEKSLCPEVVNDGRFNVKGSNQIQDDLTRSFTPPGTMDLADRDVPANICRDDVRTIHLNEDESFLLCSEGFWSALGCSVIDTIRGPDCEDIMGVVVDGPHGSGEICNEEDCTIRYHEAGRILTSPPSHTRELYPQSISAQDKEDDYIVDDPVIITTPCKVRVGCRVCLTKCLWDISTWNHIYELEQSFTYPGFRNTMSADDYWWFVENEIKVRSRIQTERW